MEVAVAAEALSVFSDLQVDELWALFMTLN